MDKATPCNHKPTTVEAWPHLPEHVRAKIRTLVDSATVDVEEDGR